MKPVLKFMTETIPAASLGADADFPDILTGSNIQNKTEFFLDESDEIYEGYGRLPNAYPYRSYTCYDRKLREKEIKTAVLENDFLQAVFLPELGGRLWRLIDKTSGRNLLYTNDVIRPSNLATRNAWFSGGVEWNVGIIGHTPLTMEPLFTAVLEGKEGEPVLRMYEYERIRKVTYQMDFWLGETSRFLNCRMRVVNHTADVVPMYWWSNMAVPEYENGRILLPASEAFTSDMTRVYKVKIPWVNGVDVTEYTQIPDQVDYFFHIPDKAPKYIANLGQDGYGLLHFSTRRLQSRKLFTWGHNQASRRWQSFLTENAGDYIEIQAGLGKTQYGCIPMAPHTAWEWMEFYGPVQTERERVFGEFEEAMAWMEPVVERIMAGEKPEEKLAETGKLAKTPGRVILRGSGYGDLENRCCEKMGVRGLDAHLDFASPDSRQKEWIRFLETGRLECPDPYERPADFTRDDFWFGQLKEAAGKDPDNWYLQYQLGLQYWNRGEEREAENAFEASEMLKPNPWAKQALAVCCAKTGEAERAVRLILDALEGKRDNLSMVKDAMKLLLWLGKYEELLDLYETLPDSTAQEGRIVFDRIQALAKTGRQEQAYRLLIENGGLEIADFREGDGGVDRLWEELCAALFPGETRQIPDKLNFSSMS